MFDAASFPHVSKNAVFAGLGAVCLVGVVATDLPVYAQSASQVAPQEEASEEGTAEEPAARSSDATFWRAPLLAEMGRIANDLDAQRRLNILLEDKVDYMTHRLDTLEQRTLEQAKRIESLQDALRRASRAPSSALDLDQGPSRQAEKTPDTKGKSPAPSGKNSSDKEDEEIGSDFQRFLDMGEAMMRRFFGVVKEFRKDFDDNRV
nr:hypothetical protein [uncultured Cohaesibacter sp.]